MDILDLPTEHVYTSAANQTAFSYGFVAYDYDYITVTVNGVVMTEDATPLTSTEYALSGDPAAAGGTVTFGAGLTAGDVVEIFRTLPLERLTRFPNSGPVPNSALNVEFDRLISILQDRRTAQDRSPSFARGATVFDFGDIAEGELLTLVAGEIVGTENNIQSIADAVTVARDIAQQSAIEAASDAASSAADRAYVEGVAGSAGIVQRYLTKAQMDADIAGISEGEFVDVEADETSGGDPTRYQKQGGVLTFVRALEAGAGMIYVSSLNGDDANGGGLIEQAKATLASAIAQLQNGDMLFVERGSFFREEMNFTGLRGIKVRNYGGGKRPIVSARELISSFAQHGATAAYTFTTTLPSIVANRGYPAVWEDGYRLYQVMVGDTGIADEAAAIAYVVANPGTFYFAGPGTTAAGWSEGVKTYYFHPQVTGENPASNGRAYETPVLNGVLTAYDADIGDGAGNGIVFHHGFEHDGLRTGAGTDYTIAPTLRGCAQVGMGSHGSLFPIASLIDHEIYASNPRYAGGMAHCSPGNTGANLRASVIKGMVMITDPRAMIGEFGDADSAGGFAFYTHGDDDNPTIEKAEWIIQDAVVRGPRQLFSFNDTSEIFARNIKFDGVYLFNALGPCDLSMTDCSVNCQKDDAGHISSGAFPATIVDDVTLNIARSFVRVGARTGFGNKNGPAGTLDIESATVIQSSTLQNGAGRMQFFSASGTMDGFRAVNSTIAIGPGFARGYLVEGTSLADVEVSDLHLLGLLTATRTPQRDPILRLGGADVALSTRSTGRVIWTAFERAVETEGPHNLTKRFGSYSHGDKLFGGAAYSRDGAQQPRASVLVGEMILREKSEGEWLALDRETSAFLRAVCFTEVYNASFPSFIAVGDGGTIYSTDQNLNAASEETSGVTDDLKGVAASSSGAAVAVGDGGRVLRSTDSGLTWSTVTSGTAADLKAIATDETTWVAVGAGGVVGTSTDDGATWTWGTQGSADYYAAVWSNTLSLFLIGGDAGTIRTSLPIISWTNRVSGQRNRISCFSDMPDGVIAGVYQTTSESLPALLVSEDGTLWSAHPENVPFDVVAMSSPGTSIYLANSTVIVGESQKVGRLRSLTGTVQYIDPVIPRAGINFDIGGFKSVVQSVA